MFSLKGYERLRGACFERRIISSLLIGGVSNARRRISSRRWSSSALEYVFIAKRPGIPYAKGRKLCIFCGAPADSREHLWPTWAHHILPNGPGHRRWTVTGRRNVGITVSKDYQRQGGNAAFRMKRVCSTCNSGWMSGYEQKIRFHLERMICGQRAFLSAEAKQTLAEYFAYKMLILDWEDDDPVLPPEWSKAFYKSRAIPPNASIWVGTCVEGEWRLCFRSAGVGIYHEDDDTFDPLAKNTKSFAIGFGDLFVFAVFSTGDFYFDFDGPLSRIWPLSDDLLIWPLRQPIMSREADAFANFLIRLTGPNILGS